MISRSSMFAIALVLCVFVQLSVAVPAASIPPQAVTDYSSAQRTRYHHLFFHTTRMNYFNLSPAFKIALGDLGWAPPRPAYAYGSNGAQIILEENGEDFLYMHRIMINTVNTISANAGSAWRVVGWDAVPAPGDKKWPVPPTYEIPGQDGANGFFAFVKGDDYYWDTIQPAEEALVEPDYLRSITLAELGAKLEFEIHTWLHVRFSGACSVGYRMQDGADPVGQVDDKWNPPAYDYLADFYSAHVNVHFWKIHGWIEKRIADWQVANGIDRITWTGTWEGGPMAALEDLFSARPAEDGQDDSEDTEDDGTDGTPVDIDDNTLASTIEILVKLIRKNTSA